MSYNLRNRNRLRRFSRFEDSDDDHDPDHETYTPISNPSTKRRYRGPVIPYNPNLPPAAFPTLDTSRQSRSQLHRDADLPALPRSEEEGAPAAGSSAFEHQDSDLYILTSTGIPIKDIRSPPDKATSTSNQALEEKTLPFPPVQRDIWHQHSSENTEHTGDTIDLTDGLGDMDDSDLMMFEIEMLSSEDEEIVVKSPQGKDTPKWSNLSIAHKVQLSDIVSKAYPREDLIPILRLSESDINELNKLLVMRNDQLVKEEADHHRYIEETIQSSMRGSGMSEIENAKLKDQTIFSNLSEDVFDICTPSEVKQAKIYLRHCDLDPKLLDGFWATLTESNTATLMRGGTRAGAPSRPINSGEIPVPVPRSGSPKDTRHDVSDTASSTRSEYTLTLQTPDQREEDDDDSFSPSLDSDDKVGRTVSNLEAFGPTTREELEFVTSSDKDRRTSGESEISFLNRERRPGARQPKLTEKAEALASPKTLISCITTPSSGGSSQKRKSSPVTPDTPTKKNINTKKRTSDGTTKNVTFK